MKSATSIVLVTSKRLYFTIAKYLSLVSVLSNTF